MQLVWPVAQVGAQPPSAPEHGSSHTPLTHGTPGAQVASHLPQLLGSISRLAQYGLPDPPQAVVPALQDSTQRVAKQASPAGQAFPHPPQLRESVWTSAQKAPPSPNGPHLARLSGQKSWQAPPEQVSPEAQGAPQVPQLEGSEERSAQ